MFPFINTKPFFVFSRLEVGPLIIMLIKNSINLICDVGPLHVTQIMKSFQLHILFIYIEFQHCNTNSADTRCQVLI